MSSIKKKAILCCVMIFTAFSLVLSGCGESNNTHSNFDVETTAHPAGWLPADHAASARNDINSCKSCHGEDLSGGISKVSCTTCHLGGPLAVHPATVNDVPWFQPSSATEGHGLFVIANGTSACKNIWCHGAHLEGVAKSGPACATCHPGEAF